MKKLIPALLLSCFMFSIATVNCLILFNSNASYAEAFAFDTAFNRGNSVKQQVNNEPLGYLSLESEQLAPEQVESQQLAYQQLEYEQKLADLSFILRQYEMMDLQTFNFVIEISEHEQLKQLMLDSLQTILADFTTMNPDIHATWQADPSDGLKLLVKLNIERKENLATSIFFI